MEKSLWHNEIKLPSFHSLKGNIKTDVLIVGGGLCGLLCAYYLKKAGIDCIVTESNNIASGTSGNTTAKITSLHGAIYGDLIEKSGIETAQKYFDINQQAIKEYEKIAITTRKEIRKIFSKSLKLRQISAGGCNGCEMELNACSNCNFDMGRFGIDFVASPRHADGIVITGPITENMAYMQRA